MNFLANDAIYSIINALTFLSTVSILIWYKERTSEVLTTAILCFGILTMDWMSFRLDALYAHDPEFVRYVWFLCWGAMSSLAILTATLAHAIAKLKFSKYFLMLVLLVSLSILVNFSAHITRFQIDFPIFHQTFYGPAVMLINYLVFILIIFKTCQIHWALRYSMIYKLHALAGKGELK